MNNYHEYQYSCWEARKQTQDEYEICDFINQNNLIQPNQSLLHIGIGSNTLYSTLRKKFDFKYTGITYSIFEYENVLINLNENYFPILLNKYNPILSKVLKKYDIIIDNNPTSYGPSDDANLEYLQILLNSLNNGGIFITHTLGLNYMRTGDILNMITKLGILSEFTFEKFSNGEADNIIVLKK